MCPLGEFCGLAGVELRHADLSWSADTVILLAEKCRSPLGATGPGLRAHGLAAVLFLGPKMPPSVVH